jgi:hypothetical protein
MPTPQPLDANSPTYTIDQGQPGDVCPPCAKQQLANLGQWQGHNGQQFPAHLLPLRLFKCRQWFWLVVLGLRQDQPISYATHTRPASSERTAEEHDGAATWGPRCPPPCYQWYAKEQHE